MYEIPTGKVSCPKSDSALFYSVYDVSCGFYLLNLISMVVLFLPQVELLMATLCAPFIPGAAIVTLLENLLKEIFVIDFALTWS